MKTIYDGPLTLNELVEFAKKRRQKLYRDYAHHLCSVMGIVPQEYSVGQYLHTEHREDNLNATIRWLKRHLGDADILQQRLDLEGSICAFRLELHKKIPPNYWGEDA